MRSRSWNVLRMQAHRMGFSHHPPRRASSLQLQPQLTTTDHDSRQPLKSKPIEPLGEKNVETKDTGGADSAAVASGYQKQGSNNGNGCVFGLAQPDLDCFQHVHGVESFGIRLRHGHRSSTNVPVVAEDSYETTGKR